MSHSFWPGNSSHNTFLNKKRQEGDIPMDSRHYSKYSKYVFDMIHDYQRRGILKSYSDANVVNVLFSPVKFMTMNKPAYDDMESGLNELIAMMQDLLLY